MNEFHFNKIMSPASISTNHDKNLFFHYLIFVKEHNFILLHVMSKKLYSISKCNSVEGAVKRVTLISFVIGKWM